MTLTWNGEDGAAWKSENWLKGTEKSAWVEGADAVIPADASIVVDDTVSVNTLTAQGALTVVGSVKSVHTGFLPTDNPVLVFPGLKLADISAISGEIGGAAVWPNSQLLPVAGCHYTYSGTKGSVQFHWLYEGICKCVDVELTEQSDGIYARSVRAYWFRNESPNVNTDAMAVTAVPVTSVANKSYYGIGNLKASVAKLKLNGATSFSGALEASNIVVEVTAPIEQTWSQDVKIFTGALVVKGETEATAEKTFGKQDSSNGANAVWLTPTASDTIFPKVKLSDLVPVSAVLNGSWISTDLEAKPYFVQLDGDTMTCQFQNWDGTHIKCAIVEFKQEDGNVTARHASGRVLLRRPESDLGKYDMTQKSDNSYDYIKYAVKSMVLRYKDVATLKLAGTTEIADAIVDNARLVLTSANAKPVSAYARNGGYIIYDSTMPANTDFGYAGRVQQMENGSELFVAQTGIMESRAVTVVDESIVRCTTTGNNVFNELTLKNGAAIKGNHINVGAAAESNTTSIVSSGTAANIIYSGVVMAKHTRTGAKTTTVLFDTKTDLTVFGNISDNASNKGAVVAKKGAATLTLSGANTFEGALTVEEGTLVLASNTALPSAVPLTLSGGKLACGSTQNTAGVLTLSGDASIELSGGSLAFANSSAATWADGAKLAITGTDPLPTQSIRFGTSEDALTVAQQSQITYNGERVRLDSDGYLRSGHRGTLVAIY